MVKNTEKIIILKASYYQLHIQHHDLASDMLCHPIASNSYTNSLSESARGMPVVVFDVVPVSLIVVKTLGQKTRQF